MSKLRRPKKTQKRLAARIKAWDALPLKAKRAYHKPGSSNPHKG